jgi:DNA mismatch repair protein MutS
VIRAAGEHLRELTAQGAAPKAAPAAPDDQFSLQQMGESALAERIRGIDPDSRTPREALQLIYELRREAGD